MTHKAHLQIILNATVLIAPTDEKAMSAFMVEIIESLGMKVAKLSNDQQNPTSWYCDDPENQGYTGSAILTTSHLAFHFWDKARPYTLKFDLYTCSDLDHEEVLHKLDDKFQIERGEWKLINRYDFGLVSTGIIENGRVETN